MTTDNGPFGDAGRRVILFRPRASKAARNGGRDASSPVSDLAKFEQTGERDDYRHRMIVNAIALAFTVVLAAMGVWIAESMAVMRKNQDCVLVGRRNCSLIEVPASDRVSGASTTDHGQSHPRQP